MYHAAETILTVSLLYLLSFSFYRLGFYSLVVHRKLWNSILAFVFLITALAGVFLALQINCKWNIPVVKIIMKWHVETGIILFTTGLFHLAWHLTYFRKLFSAAEKDPSNKELPQVSLPLIKSNLFIIGFVSTSIQLLLLREVMNISGGNELVTGIFFGSWLISSASGALLANKSNLNNLRKLNIIFALSPGISLIFFFVLSGLFQGTGVTPSMLISMIIILIILLPFCLVSGFIFVKLMLIAGSQKDLKPGKSFSIETMGGIAAGLLITVLTSGYINTYQLIIIVILMDIAYTLLSFFIRTNLGKVLIKISFPGLIMVVLIGDPDLFIRQILLPGIRLTETKDTPYGNITAGEYEGEQSIFYNQRLLAYNDNEAEREEDIHYALMQRDEPENILLISGPLGSHLQELNKYKIKKVVYIERDPEIIKAQKLEGHTGSMQLIIENRDAFSYIKSRGDSFDAAVLLLPPPSTLSLNRFYTSDFFSDLKKRLSPGGVFMCSPGPGGNYFNKESIKLYSSIFNSLSEVFKYVLPVSGNKLYFIASDEEISVSFCRLSEERQLRNKYVGCDFLADDLTERKTEEIVSLMDQEVIINRASYPIACFYYQTYYLSRDLRQKVPLAILMILAFVLPVTAVKRRNIIMYSSASALAGFEIIILFTLQLTIGNMYHLTGLIIAAIMAGMAAGSGSEMKFMRRLPVRVLAAGLAGYYLLIGLFFNYILSVRGFIPSLIIVLLLIAVPSVITGHLFRLSADSGNKLSSPASVYSSDLAGSAFGFLLVSVITVPVMGIRTSVLMLSLLIIGGILFGTDRNND